MAKNSFVMYVDWLDMLEELDDAERGILMLAVMRYQAGQELPEMGVGARVAFAQIRKQLDKDTAKYEDISAKRREVGKAGGVAKSSKTKQMLANASKDKRTVAKSSKTKQTDPDNDNVNDNDLKERHLKVSKEKRFAPPTPDEVREYCQEKGYNVDAERFVDFYESKGWMVGKNKMSDWQAAVRTWVKRNQEQAQSAQKKNGFHNFEQRDYDFDQLMKQLNEGG